MNAARIECGRSWLYLITSAAEPKKTVLRGIVREASTCRPDDELLRDFYRDHDLPAWWRIDHVECVTVDFNALGLRMTDGRLYDTSWLSLRLFVLRTVPHAFIAGQRHADSSSRHVARRWCCHRRNPGSRWLASSLRTARGLNTCRRCRLGAHERRTSTAKHDAAGAPARRRPISSPFSTSRAATSASFHRHNELTGDERSDPRANVRIGRQIEFLLAARKAVQGSQLLPQREVFQD